MQHSLPMYILAALALLLLLAFAVAGVDLMSVPTAAKYWGLSA